MSDEQKPSWPRVVSLEYPLERHAERNSETITELRFRKPIARDLRVMDDPKLGDQGKTIALVAKLSGFQVATIDMLDWDDYAKAAEEIESFLTEAGILAPQSAASEPLESSES